MEYAEMKILGVCSAIDLRKPTSTVPWWWQLCKGFYELGVEVVLTPYWGRDFPTLWWRTYENPAYLEGELVFKLLSFTKKLLKPRSSSKSERLIPFLARATTQKKWERHIFKILEKEKDINAVLMFNTALNQLCGLPKKIHHHFGIPVFYYDGDMPATLPRFGGFTFNYYKGADLTEFDGFIINSKGAVSELVELGASNVKVLYYGVDPSVYSPVNIRPDIDVFFFGTEPVKRVFWFDKMFIRPSVALPSCKFTYGGPEPWTGKVNMGRAGYEGIIRFSTWRKYCCRSKINLNLTRDAHATVYASSTSRPFELASLSCCIVSSPYLGIEEWFKVNREIFVVSNENEIIETYNLLLDDKELRLKTGLLARKRILKEHTHTHRASELLNHIKNFL